MTAKTFTFVGSSTLNGNFKVRFVNASHHVARIKTLIRDGHTDVQFIELPRPMTKEEIMASEFVAMVTPVGSTAVAA